MKWLEAMVRRALNDPYLDELTRKLEYKYAHIFLYQKDDILLTEKNLMMCYDLQIFYREVIKQTEEIKHIKLLAYYMTYIKTMCSFSIMPIQF